MSCIHKKKVWENLWCNVAFRYCTMEQQRTCKHKKQTNADHMRGMTDDELGSFLCLTFGCNGKCPGGSLCVAGDGKANGLKKWLKQLAEEE